jgi:hypothetical protein
MIGWLVEASIPQKFPWFNEFVHPLELKAVYKGQSLTLLFRGASLLKDVKPE